MPSLKYWLWLTELRGLTNQARLALLRHFESPENVFYADAGEILLTEGITRTQAALLENRDLSAAGRVLENCQRLGVSVMTIQDAAYPGRLKNIFNPPCLLYVRGRLPAMDDEAAVAVVGTRKSSPYGEASAGKLGFGLARAGAVVVSGLAAGIDAAAARGALRAGGTVVGVAGGGVDVAYPKENRYLYEDIAAAGAVLSEHPPGTAPKGSHFPVRNRILSGLSLAALVVEAPLYSGALITAAAALEQGRDIFAVPGPIDAPGSAGCNRLIQEGAGLVTEPWDMLKEYRDRFPDKLHRGGTREKPEAAGDPARRPPEPRPEPEPKPALPRFSLSRSDMSFTDDQIALLRLLTEEPILADDLIELSGIPTRRVLSALTVLEVEGLITQHSGKRYTRAVILSE